MGWSTIIHGVFETSSNFRAGWRTLGGGLISVFQGIFASIGKIFFLAGGLVAGLSFCGV